MSEMKYTDKHEWVRPEGNAATVGVSNYAQEQLGDVVYVELPAVGKSVKKGDELAVVESVKAASEIYAPAGGEIIAVNEALNDDPSLVNSAATEGGWFVKLKLSDPAELDGLMTEDAYKAYLEVLD